jgi:nucleoid-associated protein YgaU
MARVLAIVGLVGLFMATGFAGAAPADPVRLPVSGPSSSDADPGSDSVVVVEGDHLWKISAGHLRPDAADHEIAPYWLEVIDVNTPNLRSGDPDLIYPGEVVELP